MHVTLKAAIPEGEFYWVTDVDADSEDEAVVAAENKFLAVLERQDGWSFTDFDVS